MIVVILLLFLLPYFSFDPFSKDYFKKVCLSVYLHNEPTVPISRYYLTNGISLFIFPLYYMKRNEISITALFMVNAKNLKVISQYLYKGVLWLILFFSAIVSIHLIFNSVIPARANTRDVPNYIHAFGFSFAIYAAVVGPLFEEICFRGLFLLSLRKHFKSNISIIFSALLFTFVPSHMKMFSGMTAILGIGVIYAYLVHKSQSLWPSFLLHGAWNSFFLAVLYILSS